MIEVKTVPKNEKHFNRVVSFASEVLGVCDEMGVRPVLSGSLAVFAYTEDPTMEVWDIDLSCSESYFVQLRQALEEHDIDRRITGWHVLQAIRGDLKVEFDSTEHWMRNIPARHETVRTGNLQFQMISIEGLRELYSRGLVDTEGKVDVNNQRKHQSITERLRSLEAIRT